MRLLSVFKLIVWTILCSGFLLACSEVATVEATIELGDSGDDQFLQEQVEQVLAQASDLPDGLIVEVDGSTVTIAGSVRCDDCGGMRTPGNVGTIEQSMGAMIRAVPGIEQIDFAITY